MLRYLSSLILLLPVVSLAQTPLIGGFPDTSGNSITHLAHGGPLHEARLDLLQNAKSSIYLSAFSVSPDEIGKSVYALLCEKARAGLEVRVITDHRNSKSFFPYMTKLRDCGAYTLSFRPGDRWFALHEKILVVDGERVIMGGSGYSLKYRFASPDSHQPDSDLRQLSSRGWYDSDYLLEGPGACSIHHQFRTNFINIARTFSEYNPEYFWYGPKEFAQILPKYYGLGRFRNCLSQKMRGESRAVLIHNNPHKTNPKHRPILKAHLAALEQTKKGEEILLYAPYFVPGKKFVKALTDALKRGVKAKVITNSIESTDEKKFSKKLFIGMIETLTPAIEAGLKIHLWVQQSTVHRKGGKIGGVAFYGSDNLDNRAQDYQAEAVVYTDDNAVLRGIEEDFARDLERSVPLTYDYIEDVYSRASLLDKFVGKKLKRYL